MYHKLTAYPTLTNITSLSSLTLITLPSITTLSGLENLTEIDAINITNLSGITSLEGLNNLATNPGGIEFARLSILSNNQLTDFCAITTYVQNTAYGNYVPPNSGGTIYSYYEVYNNAYNPTEAQIESSTACSI